MTAGDHRLPGIEDIADAAERLHGKAVLTPLLESPLLNDRIGGRLLVKAEMLQRTGSFKFRGAYNKISRIPEARRGAGVVAYSSGNHAQGVAAAAHAFGLPATIVMPADAPAIKRRNTLAWGARVVDYDRAADDRDRIAAAIVAETGATLIPPYDDPEIVAGQGTVGLELATQATAQDAAPDAVLVPCGGGGLSAGISTALASLMPGVPVYAVEPAGFDSTGRSLRAGKVETVPPGAPSICDSLMAPAPGDLTFAVNSARLAGGLTIEDDAALAAMAIAFDAFKLVAEPGGAAALAAVISGVFDMRGKTVIAVCSGGNVDAGVFLRALGGPAG